MQLFEDLLKILKNREFLNYLIEGFFNTLFLTVLAAIIGLFIGIVVAIIKIFAEENKYLKVPAVICDIYTTVVRGTPVALQLFIMIFVILAFENFKEYAIVLTFGINSGAYISENIRAGILSVDRGQTEAGRALGLSQMQTMIKIVIPQAIKNVIPAIGNEMIALVKETAIVPIVGATPGKITFELNQAMKEITKGIGGEYLAPALLSGLLYLVIVYAITLIIKLIEKRMRASDKR